MPLRCMTYGKSCAQRACVSILVVLVLLDIVQSRAKHTPVFLVKLASSGLVVLAGATRIRL